MPSLSDEPLASTLSVRTETDRVKLATGEALPDPAMVMFTVGEVTVLPNGCATQTK